MLFLKQEPKTKERRASLRMEAWQTERELPPFQQGSSGDGLSSAFNTRPPAMAFNPSVSAAAIDQTQGGGRTQQSRWWCRVNQVAEGRVLLVPTKLKVRLVIERKNGRWQMQGRISSNSCNRRKGSDWGDDGVNRKRRGRRSLVFGLLWWWLPREEEGDGDWQEEDFFFFCAMKKEVGRWPWKGKITSQMANKSPINNQNFTFKRKWKLNLEN